MVYSDSTRAYRLSMGSYANGAIAEGGTVCVDTFHTLVLELLSGKSVLSTNG